MIDTTTEAKTEEQQRSDPGVHYAYLGLAMLLYGVLVGWCMHHVPELEKVAKVKQIDIPALAAPIFSLVNTVGAFCFAPLGIFVVLELLFPKKAGLTKAYFATTVLLVLAGLYVGIALYMTAKGLTPS